MISHQKEWGNTIHNYYYVHMRHVNIYIYFFFFMSQTIWIHFIFSVNPSCFHETINLTITLQLEMKQQKNQFRPEKEGDCLSIIFKQSIKFQINAYIAMMRHCLSKQMMKSSLKKVLKCLIYFSPKQTKVSHFSKGDCKDKIFVSVY